MDIKKEVRTRFTVNGKEYGSLEELPEDVRREVEKRLSAGAGGPEPALSVNTETRIVFNGEEYDSLESMPEDERRICEIMTRGLGTGKGIPGLLAAVTAGKRKTGGMPPSLSLTGAIQPASFSAMGRLGLICGAAILGAVVMAFFWLR